MYILVVTDNFPPVVGGVAPVGEMICPGLPPNKVCVLGPQWPGDDEVDAALPYRVVRVKYRSTRPRGQAGIGGKVQTLLGLLRLRRALRDILRREEFDVVLLTET